MGALGGGYLKKHPPRRGFVAHELSLRCQGGRGVLRRRPQDRGIRHFGAGCLAAIPRAAMGWGNRPRAVARYKVKRGTGGDGAPVLTGGGTGWVKLPPPRARGDAGG